LADRLLEALLRWAIKKHSPNEWLSALDSLLSEVAKPKDREKPDTWSLAHYIEVALKLEETRRR
jgi:hypothetical protein